MSLYTYLAYVKVYPQYPTLQGLIQGGWIGWLATPFGNAMSIILLLCLSTLIYFNKTILVNKVYMMRRKSITQKENNQQDI